LPGNDLDLLIDAARRAGEVAKPYWRQSPKTWEKDAGAGPVTEADLAVNDMLQKQLMTARPEYGWSKKLRTTRRGWAKSGFSSSIRLTARDLSSRAKKPGHILWQLLKMAGW